MARRIYLTIAIVLAVGSISFATYQAARKTSGQRTAAQGSQGRAPQPNANRRAPRAGQVSAQAALRPSDPNLAPQPAVDDALYTAEEFFGTNALVMRPYSVALERVTALAGQYPKDARLHLHAARLANRLGQFDKAAGEMVQYADLKKRSPDALRRLADFYHSRARYSDEVRTLRELAATLPVDQRSEVYKRAAVVVRSRALKEFSPSDFFAELVAADPSNFQPVRDYVEELRLANRPQEALTVLASFQPRFPGELAYFLKTRAQIIEAAGDRRAAEQVYASAFDPNWPRAVASDYYDQLRRFGRYRVVRRGLQDQIRAGASDLQTVARLFSIYAYEGGNEQAARLLTELETRRAGGQTTQPGAAQPAPVRTAGWTADEIKMAAGMFASIGHYDQSSRYLYTLYLIGGLQPATPAREDALYRLFKVMLDASGTPTRVAGGDLSLYKDIAEVDQHPGFMNGVLSLVLADTNPSGQFYAQEQAAAGYFNRAFAYRVFTAFKQEYPQSNRLGEMYLGVVNVFSSLGEHRLAIEAGREFQKSFPASPSYAEVSLRIADSYVALKDRAGERAVLAELLDKLARNKPRGVPLVPVASKKWYYGLSPQDEQLIDRIKYNIEAYSDTYEPVGDDPPSDASEDEYDVEVTEVGGAQPSDGPTYGAVLERYISSLANEEKNTETIAFFWGEIKKHPREEGLYERFLRWLGQAQIINEQLKAYNAAIRQFDSNTWYHRMGRWYVRQKRGRELARYSRQLIDIFDEEEISEYLLRFAGYGTTATGDELDWDQRLAFDLYSYARNRFPRNLFFVRGMLTYLEKHDRARWEKLSAEYYFADRSIRDPYLEWLSKQGQLRDRYKQASERSKAAAPTQPAVVQPASVQSKAIGSAFTYRIFTADAAIWLSHHEEALDAYRQLIALYPGEPQYADRLADLTRSFGKQDDKLYEESARVLAQMADIYPARHEYRVKAGEVYAELGDFKRAGEQWDTLVRMEPGNRETFLEVATIYWDYYQFDNAIRVLKDLRTVSGDQSIYAYRLGAVYEAKGDMDSAIAEYIKVLPEQGEGRDTVARRLAQLSRRTGMADKINAAYQSARSANPEQWQSIIGYAVYLAERNRQADALAHLRSEVDRSTNVAFLESVRDLFRTILRPEDEQQVITRLSSVARDEREAMMYRLQLAAFLERQNKREAAITTIDRLVADYPTNLGVVEESAQFYWRAGLVDKSLDLYKRTLARARGSNRRALTLQLARRQSEANKLQDAEATLRAFYNENRSDTEVFGELARTLGAQNRLADLADLYQGAFKDVRESGLTGDEARARVVELRLGMIKTLDRLGKRQETLDQHIEVVNLLPEDADRLAATIDYAERHNLVDRLVAYYEKLSAESYKNYRWQLVLGRIYERRGNYSGASDQYRIAVQNEPQRSDLRLNLASSFARQRRFDEAIATLREGWALAGRDPQWLIEVAKLQIQQGKRDEAIQTVRQALASKKDAKVYAQMQIASQLAGWGMSAEAVRLYEQALAQLPKSLKDEPVNYEDFATYVKVLVKTEPAPAVYQKLERLRAQYFAIGENSQDTDGYKAKSIVSRLDQAMKSDFGPGVVEYANQAETAALSSAVRSSVARHTTYGEREQMQRYLAIARGANLVDLEHDILVQIKESAFKARTKPEDTSYYTELRYLVAFHNRHASFARAAELLAAEFARDPYKDRFDYQNQIATQYRLAGDRAREMDSLRAAYQSASGDMTADHVDWVDRYLSLLYGSGSRDELTRLASLYSPHQLQLVNFLISKNERVLARSAIASAKQSPAWAASRSAEVGLFLKDTSPETETLFKRVLDIKPIGEMLGRRVDARNSLVGDDWFVAARNYGFWLGLVPARESEIRRFAAAEIEGHPSSALAQLELAAFYLDRKDTTRAAAHTQLATELAPDSREATAMRGAVAFARGDRKAALEAWSALLTGRVSVAGAQSYLKVLADNQMLREALPQLEEFLVAYLNQRSRNDDDTSRIEAVKPLVTEIANRAAADPKLAGEIAAFFHKVVVRTPNDLVIAPMLIEDNLISGAGLAAVYRTYHQRLTDNAKAVFGTPEYENGYYHRGDYVYPARALSEWRRRFVDFLIRTRAFDEARLLISAINQEEAANALELGTRDSSYESGNRYDWVPLAAALVELREGRDPALALAELKRYCGLAEASAGNRSTEQTSDGAPLQEKCLKGYSLLVAEGRRAEADALLYEAYSAAARSRYSNDASLAGLAELEARRGRMDEASRLLKLLVARSSDNAGALRLAAETAGRINALAEAIEFREQIARANAEDSVNRLELARLMLAAGRGGDAVERVIALASERTTPNSVRAQSMEVLGEIVRADRSLEGRAQTLAAERLPQSEPIAQLARASIAEADSRAAEARTALSAIKAGPLAAIAHAKLGQLALAAGNEAEAVANFERATYLDADETLTGAIAYRVSSPRAQLILLYGKSGRDLAAFRLAESDEAGRPLFIVSTLRYALSSTGSRNTDSGELFEPSLDSAQSEGSGVKTIAELNHAAIAQVGDRLLASLAESASRLEQFDKAISIERARLRDEERAEQKAVIEKRLAEVIAAQRARQLREALQPRIDRANATASLYAARFLGEVR